MSEHSETLAEIAAEIRSQSKNEKLSATRMRQRDPDDVDWALANAYDEDAKYLAHTADRIEAAAKREREAWEEAACRCVSEAVMSGKVAVVHPTSEKSSAVGNAAAMREALERIREIVTADAPADEVEIANIAYLALAAPPHEAKWTANGGYEFAYCSKCGHLQYAGWDSRAEQSEKIGDFHELYKFCPNCGAQMKGESNGSK